MELRKRDDERCGNADTGVKKGVKRDIEKSLEPTPIDSHQTCDERNERTHAPTVEGATHWVAMPSTCSASMNWLVAQTHDT